ncbi:hypothetical protein [Nonomuraea rubra]|uniref:hypothetical protein n=1 Tax=Nonomuraea rubra TaxID=46180 RepID=UPI0031EE616D
MRSKPGVLYDDSGEAMPSHVLDDVYEHLAELAWTPPGSRRCGPGSPVPAPRARTSRSCR